MKIFNNKVLICLGPGGVGKTTTSVSLAFKAATLGKKCLVMTIDPSRRLATVLNISKKNNKEKLVFKDDSGGELWGKIIEPQIAFQDFVKKFSTSGETVEDLFENVLFKQLTSTLKDSQDFTSIESLVVAYEKSDFDLIILDTPPIQNLTDFLDSPENMYNLFNSKFFQMIGSSENSKSLFKKFIGKGAQGVLGLLSKVTGQQFVEELLLFFKSLENLSLEIKSHSKKVDQILGDKKTAYLLITEVSQSKLIEAEEISEQLKLRGYSLHSIIFNRFIPVWFSKLKDIKPIKNDKNLQIFNKEKDFYIEKKKIIDNFCQSKLLPGNIVEVPILDGINSLEDIKSLTAYY